MCSDSQPSPRLHLLTSVSSARWWRLASGVWRLATWLGLACTVGTVGMQHGYQRACVTATQARRVGGRQGAADVFFSCGRCRTFLHRRSTWLVGLGAACGGDHARDGWLECTRMGERMRTRRLKESLRLLVSALSLADAALLSQERQVRCRRQNPPEEAREAVFMMATQNGVRVGVQRCRKCVETAVFLASSPRCVCSERDTSEAWSQKSWHTHISPTHYNNA
ncbi:uncharacterized protein J3D65DRAFT_634804 [Phyllosticta citribraziliensis]|uniref:Uncharacterized protein n=1 Tax=Phyllosticta citribraziliensis TaxID=989973 RepID=A0ABR1LDC2_9PEZI